MTISTNLGMLKIH